MLLLLCFVFVFCCCMIVEYMMLLGLEFESRALVSFLHLYLHATILART